MKEISDSLEGQHIQLNSDAFAAVNGDWTLAEIFARFAPRFVTVPRQPTALGESRL